MNAGVDGAALLAAGRFHEAVAALLAQVRADPVSAQPRVLLAQACARTGDTASATAWLADAVRLAPGQPQPVALLADLLLARRLHAQAAPLYERLCTEFGSRERAHLLHAGFCHEQLGDLDGAVARYRDAIEADPDFLEAHVDLAGVLWRIEDFEGSLRHAQRAQALAPQHAYAVRILGTALLNLNRLDEAESHLRHALALLPGFALAELDLAFTVLLAGRLEEGFALYALRWRDVDRVRRPPFWQAHAEWQGPERQPLAGESIAVYAEQGLGDVLQFLRYLPALQAMGAQVHAVVQPELVPLVAQSFPGVQCLAAGQQLAVRWHAALLELPLRLGTRLDTVPAQVPYLQVPAAARAAWAARLAPWAGRFRIGIAWSGSLAQVNNRNRAVPLSVFEPLLAIEGVQVFSLQKAPAAPYTDREPPPGRLVDLTGEWTDFADSGAMIESLDLVITVDTSIAHLAGALGKPVWVLLPPNADWRWLLEREDSPWYPTARLFRRGFGESREAQMARVLAALQDRLSASS